MPIDTSIPLQVKPIQLADPLELQSRALQLRHLVSQGQMQDMQMQQAKQAQDYDRSYADALRSGVGADGKLDYGATLGRLAQSGNAKGYQSLLQQKQAQDKAAADMAETAAKTGHYNAQTGELNTKVLRQKIDMSGAAISSLLQNPNVTHQDVIATIGNLAQQGILDPAQGAQMVRSLPGDPAQLRSYLLQKGLEVMDAGKRMEMLTPKFHQADNGGAIVMGSIDPLTGQFTQNQAMKKVQTPDSVASNARIAADNAASRAQSDRHFSVSQANQMSTPQYMETDAGLVALPKRLPAGQMPKAMPVTGPDGQPLGKPLKDIPAGANTAIIGNAQNINRAQQALALLSGQQVGELKGDPKATGVKGYLPQGVLNRVDPSGVDTRAMIADLGSMVLHDRSGAVVTASESPRLMPFIPNATDDAATAKKKLQRFVQVYQQEQQALSDTYSKSQGYKPSPVSPSTPPAQAAKRGAVVPVKSDNDYNSLPSGTRFQAPDGTIRVKP